MRLGTTEHQGQKSQAKYTGAEARSQERADGRRRIRLGGKIINVNETRTMADTGASKRPSSRPGATNSSVGRGVRKLPPAPVCICGAVAVS